ncbi:Splicing Factor 3A Subunit 3 [Manis pentadactyla]|nr:Splicing Factor 3A Subunit 3 [Manis pentadactyla]
METILEQQRRYHEEKERLMDVMAKEMLTKKSTLRDQINSDHRTRAMQDRYMEVSGNLRDLYDDKDGLRKEELNAISGPNEFAEFYNRLKQIKEFHRKHPNEICVPMSVEFEELLKARENPSEEAQNLVEFTDEEGYGRYLDLHDCYLKYINLKASEKLDYITYLSIFDQLFDIPKERKNAEYKRYLEMLLEYLQDYTDRVKPLQDQNELFGKIQNEFEKKWENGTFPGWPKETSSALTHAGAHLDLSAFSSWEELASLGLDRLKSALLALGLKCGGTLEERAQRLFSTKGKSLESLDTSLFAKNPKSKGIKRDTERNKDIAFLEAQIYEYVEILGEQRHLTHENVQRKQARTGEEREEEEEEQISESESEDEENEIIYNPKNLPLGWDGKPIPYWLYKLHGLNINYNCEICGNYTYRGPKAFQRHFAEWRHAHGMRCLGIPNTAHFANVTQIEDAVSLWAKLKLQKASERWQPDTEVASCQEQLSQEESCSIREAAGCLPLPPRMEVSGELFLGLTPSPPAGLTDSPKPGEKSAGPTPAPAQGKMYATFSCQGSDCFKGQITMAVCPRGLDFHELKRSNSGYTAGCSQACVTETPRCHGAASGWASCGTGAIGKCSHWLVRVAVSHTPCSDSFSGGCVSAAWDSMDQSVAIQETLAEGEYCIIISFLQAVQGVLCEGESKQSRLLGLVRYRLEQGGQEYALFLYTHRRMAITGDDVSLDQIVPVSRDFTLEEVSPDGGLYILGSDVTVQLDTAELSLVFQLPFGSHTRMFLQEVARACPGFDPETPDPEFLWLSRYRCTQSEPELSTRSLWNPVPGIWPGCARIGGGRYPSRKGR